MDSQKSNSRTIDPYSPEAMRIEFHRLAGEGDAIRETTVDLRKEQDALNEQIQALEAKKRPLDKQIRELEAPLASIEQRRSTLVRALGTKTGNPDGSMPEPVPEIVPEGEAAETARIE